MNGLKASPGGRISTTLKVSASLQLVGALPCAYNENCDDGEDSLDGLAGTVDDECDAHPTEDVESGEPYQNSNDAKVQEVAEMIRDVCTFFDQFLPNSASPQGSKPLQPVAVLQSRYGTLQHKINKQAQQKSIKGWFRYYESRSESNGLWWASEIVIPGDIANAWGVNLVHRSGQFKLTRYEMEALEADSLLRLCGEFKVCPTNMIQFKSKKGAQKSAALNLLLTMDLGSLPDAEYGLKGNGQLGQIKSVKETGNGDDKLTIPKERFHLESIKYYGAVKRSEGDFLSSDNPCMVQCIVSVKDTICNDMDQTFLEVKTEFQQNRNDSLNASFDKLRPALMDRGATPNDVSSVFSSMKKSNPNIAYDVALPKWASAKFQSKLFLYELEFYFCKDGTDATPLSGAMGLDANAATRIGILCGCDLYERFEHFDKVLCADFAPASSLCTASSSANIRVRMCRRTEATLTEMDQQLKCTSPEINLENGEDPITLAKCFNIILFDHGRTYGLGPQPVWSELLKRLDEESEPGNCRTYAFLPLRLSTPNPEVNWRLVWDVVHNRTTHVSSHANFCFPSSFFQQISLVLTLGTSVACAVSILSSVAGRDAEWGRDLIRTKGWISIPLLALSTWTSIILRKSIPTALLRNRFISQPLGFGGRIFIAKKEDPVSWYVLAPLLWRILTMMLNMLHTKFRSPRSVKYCMHLWRCYYMRHPFEKRLPALYLKGLSFAHHELSLFHEIYGKSFFVPTTKPSPGSSISNLLADHGLLVPELTQTLPMPRDMLYLCHHASNFMPKLERVYTLRVVASRLGEFQRIAGKLLQYEVAEDRILSITDKATSIHNNTATGDSALREHERLEVLGDSILSFFIVLNLFAKQSSYAEYALDLFEEVISLQGQNKVLFKAAMQIGLYRLVNVGNLSSTRLWRSKYNTTSNVPLTTHAQTMELSKSQMSDTVESVLGATYILDPSGCMTLGFLNEIGSCLPNIEEEAFDQTTNWFAGTGACLTEGYPFDSHSRWAMELAEIQSLLHQKHGILSTLQSKAADLCCLLTKQVNCREQMEMLQLDSKASLLLHCALFDDSIDEEASSPETIGLEPFASLRDKIFHVGNAALQLSIISEIHHLYPTNTSGDIHMMKVCSMSHDALAYILVKNGLHKCLFDTHSDASIIMQGYMEESDLLGAKEWAKHNGWIISGGIGEFCRRVQQFCGDDLCFGKQARPQYMGLAAGRLWGHKHKLNDDATDDLQFSMKCIVGALTLTFGVDDAWDMLRPFFLELILLTPEELRTNYIGVSDLVSVYKKGNK